MLDELVELLQDDHSYNVLYNSKQILCIISCKFQLVLHCNINDPSGSGWGGWLIVLLNLVWWMSRMKLGNIFICAKQSIIQVDCLESKWWIEMVGMDDQGIQTKCGGKQNGEHLMSNHTSYYTVWPKWLIQVAAWSGWSEVLYSDPLITLFDLKSSSFMYNIW